MHTAVEAAAGCTACIREVEHLRKASEFQESEIEAYASFYGIGGRDVGSLKAIGRRVGLSPEETELAIMEVADWLTANSPLRSLPRRCSVCGHAQGPEDLAHLREPVAA